MDEKELNEIEKRDDALDPETYIEEMSFKDGTFKAKLSASWIPTMARETAEIFREFGGENFLTFSITDASDESEPIRLDITIQRTHGKSPADLIDEIKREVEALRKELKTAHDAAAALIASGEEFVHKEIRGFELARTTRVGFECNKIARFCKVIRIECSYSKSKFCGPYRGDPACGHHNLSYHKAGGTLASVLRLGMTEDEADRFIAKTVESRR